MLELIKFIAENYCTVVLMLLTSFSVQKVHHPARILFLRGAGLRAPKYILFPGMQRGFVLYFCLFLDGVNKPLRIIPKYFLEGVRGELSVRWYTNHPSITLLSTKYL